MLRLLCDRLFTFVTTIDIDPTSRTVVSISLDCLPPIMGESFSTLDRSDVAAGYLLPAPET